MVSIEEIEERPDPAELRREAFEQKIDALLERGVPRRWIERHTGLRLA